MRQHLQGRTCVCVWCQKRIDTTWETRRNQTQTAFQVARAHLCFSYRLAVLIAERPKQKRRGPVRLGQIEGGARDVRDGRWDSKRAPPKPGRLTGAANSAHLAGANSPYLGADSLAMQRRREGCWLTAIVMLIRYITKSQGRSARLFKWTGQHAYQGGGSKCAGCCTISQEHHSNLRVSKCRQKVKAAQRAREDKGRGPFGAGDTLSKARLPALSHRHQVVVRARGLLREAALVSSR